MIDQIKRVDGAIGGARIALTHLRLEIAELVKLGDAIQIDLDRMKAVADNGDSVEAEEEALNMPEGIKPTHVPATESFAKLREVTGSNGKTSAGAVKEKAATS